jgi:hypothetical protein
VLTCDCGARFEVDDKLAGQEVTCPECQQTLRAPPQRRVPVRSSGYALGSVVLALVGAFTVVGTLAAVVLGVLALGQIARNRERLTGFGFATFGIVLGVVFTVLTIFALSRSELFGLGAWMREKTMAGQIDRSGPLTVDVRKGGQACTITRPSEQWGRVAQDRSEEPAVHPLQKERDLLLMHVQRHAYVDVHIDPNSAGLTLDNYLSVIRADFSGKKPDFGAGFPAEEEPPLPGTELIRMDDGRDPDVPEGYKGRELIVRARLGAQPWSFIIRLYQKEGGDFRANNNPIYVVRAYTPTRRFDLNQAELRKALDSFRISP